MTERLAPTSTGVPIYCPHAGCSWSFDRAGKRGEGYLDVHLRIIHKGQPDPRQAVLGPPLPLPAPVSVPITNGQRIAKPEPEQPRETASQTWARGHSRQPITYTAALAMFRATVEHLGHFPSVTEYQELHRSPSLPTLYRLFGSWPNLRELCGAETPETRGHLVWTPEKVVEAVAAFRTRKRRDPTTVDLTSEHGLPTKKVLNRLYGSWPEAREALGIAASEHGRKPVLSGREPQGRETGAHSAPSPAEADGDQFAVYGDSPEPVSPDELGVTPNADGCSALAAVLRSLADAVESDVFSDAALWLIAWLAIEARKGLDA